MLLRTDSVFLRPMNNLLPNPLVYAETGADVDTVLVDGRIAVEHGEVRPSRRCVCVPRRGGCRPPAYTQPGRLDPWPHTGTLVSPQPACCCRHSVPRAALCRTLTHTPASRSRERF